MLTHENVQIKICNTQYADHEESVIEFSVYGKYHAFPNMHSILYEEKLFADNHQEIVSKNIMKIQKDRLTIIKKGMIKTEMVFRSGDIHTGFYQTPYGVFDMSLHTRNLHILSNTEQINISLDYALELNGQHISDNLMSIQIIDSDFSSASE